MKIDRVKALAAAAPLLVAALVVLGMPAPLWAQAKDVGSIFTCTSAGGRRLTLQHRVRNNIPLDQETCERTLQHVAHLWGYRVKLVEIYGDTGKTVKEHETLPLP